jgi:hypothetical protein
MNTEELIKQCNTLLANIEADLKKLDELEKILIDYESKN